MSDHRIAAAIADDGIWYLWVLCRQRLARGWLGGCRWRFVPVRPWFFSRPFPEVRGEGVRARADTRGVCTFCTISSVNQIHGTAVLRVGIEINWDLRQTLSYLHSSRITDKIFERTPILDEIATMSDTGCRTAKVHLIEDKHYKIPRLGLLLEMLVVKEIKKCQSHWRITDSSSSRTDQGIFSKKREKIFPTELF